VLLPPPRDLEVDRRRAQQMGPQRLGLAGVLQPTVLLHPGQDLPVVGGQQPDASIDEVSVRTAISALPGLQRQVLTEIYYRDRSVAETARILQIPPGTVKSRTFYALKALKLALQERGLAP